jgi:hypothetical protein
MSNSHNELPVQFDEGMGASGNSRRYGKSVQLPPSKGLLDAVLGPAHANIADNFTSSIRDHHVDGANFNGGYDAIAVTRLSEIPGSLTWEKSKYDSFVALV